VNGWAELNQTEERELRLHENRTAAVQTADADAVIATQLKHGGRVALLIDAVTRRRNVTVTTGVNLLRIHTLHPLSFVHVDTERPASWQVMVDQLTHGTPEHVNSAFHPSAVGESSNGLSD